MNTKAVLNGGMYPERFWDISWSPEWTEADFKDKVERELSPTEIERFLLHPIQLDGTYKGCLGDVGDRFFFGQNKDNNGIRISEENL